MRTSSYKKNRAGWVTETPVMGEHSEWGAVTVKPH